MIMEISPTIALFTGYFYQQIKQTLDAGKISELHLENKVKKNFENGRKVIQGIYSSSGKLIEYENSGRHLDRFA